MSSSRWGGGLGGSRTTAMDTAWRWLFLVWCCLPPWFLYQRWITLEVSMYTFVRVCGGAAEVFHFICHLRI
jgi:hypothetical protein